MSIKLLILLTAAVIIFIGRFITRTLNKVSQSGSINKIKKNPVLAVKYADDLDFYYGKRECDLATFDLIRNKIHSATAIGKYRILYAIDADTSRILVFTELTFEDLNFNAKGQVGDSQEKVYHDFVVAFNSEKLELMVYSSTFGTTTDKFQKQEFLKSILETEASTPSQNRLN
jgi:hypothetical protein